MEHVAPKLTYRVDLPGGQRRLKEAALYICQKCADADAFGLVKLNKMLWRADFEAFAERGQPVTGRQYQRLKQGPAPVEMPIILEEMQADGQLQIDKVQVIDFFEKRPRALVDPSLHQFSPEDISYLDRSIRFYFERTGRGASNQSHGVAWATRANGDAMPYELAWLSDEPLNEGDRDFYLTLGRSKGWRSN